MKKISVGIFMSLLGIAVLLSYAAAGATEKTQKQEKPLIQMAILLDTSNSMDGLINQAKTQLWNIVNQMALAEKNGTTPQLEVALYEYGKSTLPATEGYLRMIVPLSTDLDRISEELFKLKTNGGSEYCGQVIRQSTRELQWSPDNNQLKVIFIAGNEPFTQGGVDYKTACKAAISRGIVVNTIFCGNYNEGIRTQWKDGAELADGKYMNINQDKKAVHFNAPQDQQITDLGKKLNQTYVAYGQKGKKLKERQKTQDSNAVAAGTGTNVQRSIAKASKHYKNVSWDLVDAEKEGNIKIEEVEEDQLPEEMKKMTTGERKQYIKQKQQEREKIQAEINRLRKERDKFVAEKRKKMAAKDTLDSVIIGAVRQQAQKKNYHFENNKQNNKEEKKKQPQK